MKTIQITLNQDEANLLLHSVEALQDRKARNPKVGATELRDLSILWDKVFDTGRAAGFGERE